MPVSQEYTAYIIDQLEGLGEVTARRMFGGVGIYAADRVFFALIADDLLYFKVDDFSRADFEAAGMEPFRPFGRESYAMQYYEVPLEVVEDREELLKWAEKAYQAALRKKTTKKKKPASRRKR